MNLQMWQNPATQRNVATLKADGVHIIGPGNGDQACGEIGDGRMLEPAEIMAALDAWAQPKTLLGKRVLITAGPTQEAIDPVRVITNHSSGKMGYALAQACAEAGAEVVLVSGPTHLPTPFAGVALGEPGSVRRVNVISAGQMLAAVEAEVDETDIFRDRTEEEGPQPRLRTLLVRDPSEHPDTTAIAEAVIQTCDRMDVPCVAVMGNGGHAIEALADLIGLLDFASVYAALMQRRDPSRSAEDIDPRFGRHQSGGTSWNV